MGIVLHVVAVLPPGLLGAVLVYVFVLHVARLNTDGKRPTREQSIENVKDVWIWPIIGGALLASALASVGLWACGGHA